MGRRKFKGEAKIFEVIGKITQKEKADKSAINFNLLVRRETVQKNSQARRKKLKDSKILHLP